MAYFEVMGKPQGKARARTFYNPKLGRSQSITPENTVLYENLVKQSFLAKNNDRYFNSEPLCIDIEAYYPILKSMSKKDRERVCKGELFPTKKPDADNIAKVICDALNGVAYGDDAQIVALNVYKLYADKEPLVKVRIAEISQSF